jgi:hypothetical protein
MDLSNLQSELVKYGTLLVQKYKAQLKIDGTQATGDTEKSLNYVVGTAELEILADRSIKFIDESRGAGGNPPISRILEWMRAKGIKPSSNNKKISEWFIAKRISETIGENGTIKRFGYKGSGIIDFVYLNQKDEMLNNIFAAYGRDVQEELNKIANT